MKQAITFPDPKRIWINLHRICCDIGHPSNRSATALHSSQVGWVYRPLVWENFVRSEFDSSYPGIFSHKPRGQERLILEAESNLLSATLRMLERMSTLSELPCSVPSAMTCLILDSDLILLAGLTGESEVRGVTKFHQKIQSENRQLQSLDFDAKALGWADGSTQIIELAARLANQQDVFREKFFLPMVRCRMVATRQIFESKPLALIKDRWQLQGKRPKKAKPETQSGQGFGG